MADNSSVLSVSIVTPDGRVYEHESTFLVVTTKLGQLGIMPNHVPVITSLEVDEVRIKHDDTEDKVAVNGGFLEFSNNTATIVADSAERQDDIDVARAENARQRAEKTIKQAQAAHDADSLARAEVALRRAVNRINVAKH
ncbi:ATP synthase epsilon chain [Levilactobacillus namurensis]|uniref:ATP synthase epsilon chain n=1 Tax=Levilactobacillus namurensis TaxID=380393 RepID=A0AAW8W3J6_9LACO|nr:F0F1 ATP synthase subunit epsilon [Levilactobacillus namurensis]MDT7014087.1 F0F1 ATP synthase subunit epsilon [Levilactobacillus namurensis]PTM24727.1 F0F1 ATP synthase subunit epsilon [Lactobacillus sp. PFC-70]GEO73804.1 ATP synthase epsilon chain [Levilactobacillus namurensis]HJE45345.1 F0F1 ATP synthase subunit epsilon [Levilactobacillus namurensis]